MVDNTIKVLSIEDNHGDARLIQVYLAEAQSLGWDLPRFEVEHVTTLSAALDRLDEGRIDVVLSDLDLPDSRAGDTFARVHAHALDVPIVVLTGREDKELARQTVRAGAEDYLFKREMSGSLLAHALIYAMERQQNKQALQTAHDHLERRVEERTEELQRANVELRAEITHRKRVEAAYRESTERVTQILESIRDGFISMDEALRVTYFNEAAARLLGRSVGEVLGRPLFDAFPEARGSIFEEMYTRAVRERIPLSFETYFGVAPYENWYDVRVYPYRDGISAYFTIITERKEMENALRESEEKFRALFNRAGDAIFIHNLEGYFLEVNQEAVDRLGYSREEFLSMTPRDIDSPKYAALVPERLETLEREGQVIFETEHVTRTGEVLPLELSSRIIHYEGEPAILSVARDITERLRTEAAVQEAHATFSLFMDWIPGSVFINDAEGRILYANVYQEKHFCGEDCVGKTLEEVFPNTLPAEFQEANRRVLEEGAFTVLETIPCRDGVERTYRTTKFPIPRAGQPDLIGGVGLDVSDLKEVERALQITQERFLQILHHAPALISLIDEEGKYLVVNDAVAQVVGKPVEGIVGHTLDELLPPEVASMFLERVRSVLETGTSRVVEDDVGERSFTTTLFPIYDTQLQPYAVAGVALDVTERKRAEEQVHRYAEELERSNRELQQFAYLVSHDLREPLRAVRGFLKVLEQQYGESLDEEGREYILFATDGAERMRKMIQGLLELSRVESRGGELEPVDSQAVLDETLNDLWQAIEESGAEVISSPLPRVMADPVQLRILFQNLLSNAIKFRQSAQTPRVRITAERANDAWTFSVRDNGIGVDLEQTERLFQVFRRLHTHEEYPGTGIGLALSKRIVERHGGAIWVEAGEEGGSVFSFTLPAATED